MVLGRKWCESGGLLLIFWSQQSKHELAFVRNEAHQPQTGMPRVLSSVSLPVHTMMRVSALPLALLLVALLLGQQAAGARKIGGRCPPPGFDALPSSEFNITQHIEAPWYVQQQVSEKGRVGPPAAAALAHQRLSP